ncbi:zinc dependent phospholipase C family protein [Anaerosalibacter sp. Marseille-P3206]|uniref:zinc dependent phospholipase C family protein n=1 Tax=Anaerosalibacter sp. Marseille-P3206 TaxID=1871005 RepID=UPI001F18C3CC|nr:zinc dependent phospholipase C family protein [Anaerosalibacter sp. Marseille-P3206]
MIEIEILEKAYYHFLSTILGIANPIKKSIIKTQCKVHKAINLDALIILKNDIYTDEYNFFYNFILDINEGAVWADQDFKSSNHLYNPYKKRGLYVRKNAMDLAVEYYYKALSLWRNEEFSESLFYLGATLHIIQDMTIPQHANIRLLDNHHQYESYVKRTYDYIRDFQVKKGTYLLDTVEDYIRFNARVAIKIYNNFKTISNDEKRFYHITKCALPLAKRTTAGAMVMFYDDIKKGFY